MKPFWSVVNPVTTSVEETVTGAEAMIVDEVQSGALNQTGIVVEGVSICTPKLDCCVQSEAEPVGQTEIHESAVRQIRSEVIDPHAFVDVPTLYFEVV